jgi:purine nucleosidase
LICRTLPSRLIRSRTKEGHDNRLALVVLMSILEEILVKKIIHDCDNTMGVAGCDVDDGLAILYLMGRADIEILGITSVYGNSDVETVYANTSAMMEELGRGEIPVVKGCPDANSRESEAARFIVDMANLNEGALSILATGPLTNLYAAYLLDETVFKKVHEIILMGGVTEPLIINGRELKELNLSCDPEATNNVLMNGKNVTAITGNACLDAFFPQFDFHERLTLSKSPMAKYISEKCSYWFEQMMETFDVKGFYNWDVVAAVRLAEPSLFRDVKYRFKPGMRELKRGFLIESNEGSSRPCVINKPEIKNIKAFSDEVYGAWLR